MNKLPQSRGEKLKVIRDVMAGKISPKDIPVPITGMLVVDNSKVYMHVCNDGTVEFFEDGITQNEFINRQNHE